MMDVDSKLKTTKTLLKSCFFSPCRFLSENKFAEINSSGNFKVLKVAIIGLLESVAQFL